MNYKIYAIEGIHFIFIQQENLSLKKVKINGIDWENSLLIQHKNLCLVKVEIHCIQARSSLLVSQYYPHEVNKKIYVGRTLGKT